MLQSMGSQGVGHDLVTEQQQNKIGFFSKQEEMLDQQLVSDTDQDEKTRPAFIHKNKS